jgi:hypothetical protein
VPPLSLGADVLEQRMCLHPLDPGDKGWALLSDFHRLESRVVDGAFKHGESGRYGETVEVHVHWLIGSTQVVASVQVVNEPLLDHRQALSQRSLVLLVRKLGAGCFKEGAHYKWIELQLHEPMLGCLHVGSNVSWSILAWGKGKTLASSVFTCEHGNDRRLVDHGAIRSLENGNEPSVEVQMPLSLDPEVSLNSLVFDLFGRKRKNGPFDEWSEVVGVHAETGLVCGGLGLITAGVVEGFGICRLMKRKEPAKAKKGLAFY